MIASCGLIHNIVDSCKLFPCMAMSKAIYTTAPAEWYSYFLRWWLLSSQLFTLTNKWSQSLLVVHAFCNTGISWKEENILDTVIQAFITSHLEYRNSLYSCLTQRHTQNAAARLLTNPTEECTTLLCTHVLVLAPDHISALLTLTCLRSSGWGL